MQPWLGVVLFIPRGSQLKTSKYFEFSEASRFDGPETMVWSIAPRSSIKSIPDSPGPPGLKSTTPPYLGSVTETTAGRFAIASATVGRVESPFADEFQSRGTSSLAHWNPSKHVTYWSEVDGTIWISQEMLSVRYS